MKKFILGAFSVVGLAYYGCYMFELGRSDYAIKYWGCRK